MKSASLNRCKGMEDQVGDFLKQLAAKLELVLLISLSSCVVLSIYGSFITMSFQRPSVPPYLLTSINKLISLSIVTLFPPIKYFPVSLLIPYVLSVSFFLCEYFSRHSPSNEVSSSSICGVSSSANASGCPSSWPQGNASGSSWPQGNAGGIFSIASWSGVNLETISTDDFFCCSIIGSNIFPKSS